MDRPALIKLSHHVENEYLAFHNELSKLEVLEYPTKACVELISLLNKLVLKKIKTIKQIRKRIQRTDGSINLGDEKDEIILEREKLFVIFAKFLDWISGAPTQKVPWSLIPSVERLAKEIIPDYATIVYCQNLYNYSILGFYKISEELKKLNKYRFISLPRLHRINILMHTMIGHELFHPLCEEFTLRHEKNVATNIIANSAKKFPKMRLDQINKMLLQAWRRALHELMCDMASAELFGPAALLAMRAFASFSVLDEMPGYHNNFYPPWQYRFEVVWQQTMGQTPLDSIWNKIPEGDVADICQFFKNEVCSFGTTLSSGKGYKQILKESKFSISYKEVDGLVEDAYDFVKSKLPNSISRWHETKVIDQIPDLVNRLSMTAL